jgi:glycosyltransferase involved in cell wall biosynthesis
MKIAYLITRSDAVGGASIHVRDLGAAMQAAGHQVRVYVGGEGVVSGRMRAAGLEVHALQWLGREISPVKDWLAYRELGAALGAWKPDIVSAHTSKAGWLGRAAAHRLGIPVVYTPHGWTVGDRMGRLRGEVFTLAERWAAPWADAIVCVCDYERRLALARRVAPGGLLQVIHNGVVDTAEELRARPGVEPVRMVQVARLEKPKDPETLLLGLGRLRGLDWTLDLVGDGPIEGALRRLAEELGIGGRVRFLGYREEPAEVLAGAQIFVLATHSEGFPRSILEAMRAGLPVVGSDVGGVGEAVVDGETGRVVEAGRADRLAAALEPLILDAKVREQYGAAGRQRYSACFRFDQMAGTTRRLYETLVERRAGA